MLIPLGMDFEKVVQSSDIGLNHILDVTILLSEYTPLDLSINNIDLKTVDITNAKECQGYIDEVNYLNVSKVAYGGYLEKRSLYSNAQNFIGSTPRDIHLGIDFWCKAGTKVIAPIGGKVHSFKNNNTLFDYGPTIILEHKIDESRFYTLYGHLSVESLTGLQIGKVFARGDVLGTIGTPEVNVGYAPHLHFQLILDLQGYSGDYPGVCNEADLIFYSKNCPNPNLLLQL